MNMDYIYKLLLKADYTLLEISRMTKDEMFENILNYEGLIGYAHWIKDIIESLYDMEVK